MAIYQDVAETTKGKVQGFQNGRCMYFGGIPYAGSTAGPARFRPPKPAEAWSGIRPAVYAGPINNQNPTRFEPFIGPDPQPQSEDSLSLNVWTPRLDDAKRPVYVWLHGGANVSGAGSFPLFDGSSFAKNGDIVCVTINYRLGERGFLHLAHVNEGYASSGNSALLDQMAALQWVRDNIASFGGDPDQVTLGGQSAGGSAVTALMMMPDAQGLFHQAIIQSATITGFREQDVAEETTDIFMTAAQATDVNTLESLPIEALLAAQRITMTSRPLWEGSIFRPVVDDATLGKNVMPAAADGDVSKIPILIGMTSEEWNPFHFFMKPENIPSDEASLAAFFDGITGDGQNVVSSYHEMIGKRPPGEIYSAAVSDWRWRAPTAEYAGLLSENQDVYAYEFVWRSPTNDGRLGAGHCVELPFCFNNMSTPSTPYLIGSNAPVELANTMHSAWIDFIKSGSPENLTTGDWPTYDIENRTTMMFANNSQTENDPHATRRIYWEKIKL